MRTRVTACLVTVAVCGLLVAALRAGTGTNGASQAADASRSDSLVYADFENAAEGRPISSRGGKLRLWGYQENPTRMSIFKGDEADNAIPRLVRTSKTDQNHAAAFEFQLVIPNQWAGVSMEVQGRPGEEGALPADDVTGYKILSLQTYVTGTSYMRVEIMSNGQGINLHSGYPMTSFKLKEGFNTYKVKLSSFSQPAWVEGTRIDPKDVLAKLTSVTLSVFCDDCRPTSGMVIVDNLVFEK